MPIPSDEAAVEVPGRAESRYTPNDEDAKHISIVMTTALADVSSLPGVPELPA